MDLERHVAAFEEYAAARLAECAGDDYPMRLKIVHTRNVLENARFIAASEHPAPELERAALLGALYHDLGRFRQYLRHRSFKDSAACNHGRLGVAELLATGLLKGEAPGLVRAVLAAVALHNRRRLPAKLPAAAKFAADVTRDADKLDILRVIDAHLKGPEPYNPTVVLSLPADPGLFSRKTIADAMQGRIASYADLKSVNDFRLLLGTWFYGLNFAASKRRFVEAGHARSLLQGLPDSAPYREAKEKLLAAPALAGPQASLA